ncbi:hypothetical protein CN553_31030 [Bacillus cereus]|uniref:Uncharacterized protein n=1 Tax=Bacillus cereus TaxID=1396 RepID=A0A9X6YJE1_BACCE|nr:hypothetical protein CN553_31030 [Bacillus cereus]
MAVPKLVPNVLNSTGSLVPRIVPVGPKLKAYNPPGSPNSVGPVGRVNGGIGGNIGPTKL